MKSYIYIHFMLSNWFKLIISSIILLSSLSGCSKESPNSYKNYNRGTLTFYNKSGSAVVINSISQHRTGDYETKEITRIVHNETRFQLPNLIDGGVVFDGGDRINLRYSSKAVDQNGTPLFIKTISFIVNGTAVIRIKGQDGSYDINGN